MAAILAVAVVGLIAALVVVTTGGDSKQSATVVTASGAPHRSGETVWLSDAQFVDCAADQPTAGLPKGTKAVRAGVLVTDTSVLMVAELDGPPLRPNDGSVEAGDWFTGVDLILWQPMSDGRYEMLYRYVLGYLTAGTMLSGTGHGGGLIDPGANHFFIDGNFIGVTIDRGALSEIEGLGSLAFSAEGRPSVMGGDSEYPSPAATIVVSGGWNESGVHYCPGPGKSAVVRSFP